MLGKLEEWLSLPFCQFRKSHTSAASFSNPHSSTNRLYCSFLSQTHAVCSAAPAARQLAIGYALEHRVTSDPEIGVTSTGTVSSISETLLMTRLV
jgi:hypothetical protein